MTTPLLEDHFGFLRYDRPIAFDGITITPMPSYSEIVTGINGVEDEESGRE